MGAICTKIEAVIQEESQDADIKRKIEREAKREKKVQKLLLLGAGESGKSTIFKQIKFLFRTDLSDLERSSYVPIIHANVFQSIRTLLIGCKEFGESEEQNSSKYVLQPENQEDILYARQQTTGIVETEFSATNGVLYKLFDVGGQRNERRKWMHLFDGVTAIIFCVALSEYDQMLLEDDQKNRMMETKELFDWLLQQPWFANTSFLVFLNKYDIFEEKALKVPLSVCNWFQDYQPLTTSSEEIERAYKFVEQKFREAYEHSTPSNNLDRLFSIYRTTAIEKEVIKRTFELVERSLAIQRLRRIDYL